MFAHATQKSFSLAISIFRVRAGTLTKTQLALTKRHLNSKELKALSHGAIFLATCNAILLLRDAN